MQNATIKNAINIDKGVIVKDTILRFQNGNTDYPHKLTAHVPYLGLFDFIFYQPHKSQESAEKISSFYVKAKLNNDYRYKCK